MISDYLELGKARLNFLVLVSTFVGFYAGSPDVIDKWLLFHTLVATSLVALGSGALNQLIEMKIDATMNRTKDRPLPAGRLTQRQALFFGCVTSLTGLAYLLISVNILTCAIAAITLISYLLVYTPLKRITWYNTLVGAVPGAFPPLLGWTAATDHLALGGLSLFAILFFWQIPHFFAIAWVYREDYRLAGFHMLPVIDPDGKRTAFQAIIHTFLLLAASVLPSWLGITGKVYLVGAIILGLAFLVLAFRFLGDKSNRTARILFFGSVFYLPLLLALIVFDKK
ncbi:MAG: heme o synthase [Verrucomicrobiota bacterium]|nr:heme o synthase [Verrucomicrobiota bacterium]